MAGNVDKHRYCAFEVYPESAPEDWWQVLKDTHCMYARSFHPGEDGHKDHYHVMYCHGSPLRDAALIKCVPEGIAANGHVEVVIAPRVYMRYLIHLDDPEKTQFPDGREHIECIGGFPLDLSPELTQEQRKQMKREIFQYIRATEIYEYCDLLDSLEYDLMYDHLDVAAGNTITFKGYIDSRRNKLRDYVNSGKPDGKVTGSVSGDDVPARDEPEQ